MNEWNVVGVLVVVAGLFLSVGAPVIRLNSTLTKLSTLVEAVQSRQPPPPVETQRRAGRGSQ